MILERTIFCVSYSIVVLPVISSTLTFETPFNLAIACWRLSALKSAHVLHPVQSVFEAFRITFSVFFQLVHPSIGRSFDPESLLLVC